MTPGPFDDRVIVLAPTGRDGPVIEKVLGDASIPVTLTASLDDLCRAVDGFPGAAIVAEEALTNAALPTFTQALARQPVWSDLPLIVLTGGGSTTRYSHRIATELQVIGNVTLLERPLRVLTLVSAVRAALRARRRQHQVRDLVQQTQEQVRQRDQFLALLGHELRNPLAAIRTSVEVMRTVDTDLHPVCAEHRDIIARQTSHLALLVDDLLDVARITAGKITLDRQPTRLADVVRNSVNTLRLAIRPLTQSIVIEHLDESLHASGDVVRLEQIVTNLVGNAIKYSPPDGRVGISLRPAPATPANDGDGAGAAAAVITVSDDGIGIPDQMLGHIFEPFVRVDGPQTRLRSGLGMGLAIVRGLAELHGGSVAVASDGPGRGSTFTVRLPTCPAPASVKRAAAKGDRPSRSVLIVEDGDDARRSMLTLLRLWGHKAQAAHDGPTGVQRALEVRPEIALVDIGLPGLDGYEVARQIRTLLGDRIHLIALTGYGQQEDRQKAFEAGFDRHLVKPVDPKLLADVLAAPTTPRPQTT